MSLKFKFLEPYTDDTFYSKVLAFLMAKTDGSEVFSVDDTLTYLSKFVVSLDTDIETFKTSKLNNYRQFKKLVNRLIKIKLDSSVPDIDIDNFKSYFPEIKDNYYLSQLFDNAIDFSTDNSKDFSDLMNGIVEAISIYNQLKLLDDSIIALDNYLNDDVDESLISKVQDFKNIIDIAYHKFTELNFEKNDTNDVFWYFDEASCDIISEETITYLKDAFVVFKTGLSVIDNYINGITSGKVYIIAAPSNHGKSLTMTNITKNIIELNKHIFDEDGKDVILYYTLEDDKFNNQKRSFSIYGNFNPGPINKYHEFFLDRKNKQYSKKFQGFISELLKDSIITHTDGKVNLVLIQAEEGTTSIKDVIQFIEKLKFKGYRVKLAIIDYIEAMATSIPDVKSDDYVKQGQIVREMRRLSRIYKIPVITASQLQRYASDPTAELNNSLMGDSIRKIQFSDFVIMLRQNHTKQLTSELISQHLSDSDERMDIDTLIDANKYGFVPIDIAVTKAKDGKLSGTKVVLKSDSNLRIESNWNVAVMNAKESVVRTSKFEQKFKNLTISDLSFDVNSDKVELGFI